MTIHTRSANSNDHRLQTPETFVRAALPGMRHATAIVHASPAGGARFVQYTAEFEPGGSLAASGDQRFVYVLDGHLTAGGARLGAGDFAYVAAGADTPVSTEVACRAAVIEKPYEAIGGRPPASFTGRESQVAPTHLADDRWLTVRALIPDDNAFDFRVNTMTFEPGAALPAVEIHVMEHGLLMLEGGGIYRLGSQWYPVEAGDFIWMDRYCPQWFGAIGKQVAKYLIYKDWDRYPR
ncbi:MAG TPA: (S)-ureidoglycine aminohydrolase [Vicinamibacterales bacterium]|jgi:(S)-ureidoglycine aminohydrolase|nr:(S)-ureidoglycine aminohydrolase [Vicinamibacterales bacterium]